MPVFLTSLPHGANGRSVREKVPADLPSHWGPQQSSTQQPPECGSWVGGSESHSLLHKAHAQSRGLLLALPLRYSSQRESAPVTTPTLKDSDGELSVSVLMKCLCLAFLSH